MLTTPQKLFSTFGNRFLVREKVNMAGIRTCKQKMTEDTADRCTIAGF